ncbi:MAG: GNAT family N-acetyltransferase [Thermoplasmata archaeon]|nr:GNAT family N-acetyltransferase [Thermoplasmata archaeon]
MRDIQIRNINKGTDLEKFTEFLNLAHADYPGHTDYSTDTVKHYIFEDPDFDEKGNFLAIRDSKIVGSVNADVESEEAGFISMLILPEYRFKGLEEVLYDTAAGYLASVGMRSLRAMVHVQFTDMMKFYRKRGYNDKWTHYSMKRDMGSPIPEFIIPEGVTIHVPDLENEYSVVRATIADGFSDTMDSTEEMMMNFDDVIKEEFFQKEGILVAKSASGKMLGVCVAVIHPAMKDMGHIPWLAVLKENRGNGIGKALLFSCLAWLKEKGTKQTNLSVELGNPNALKLYTSTGFEIVSEMRYLEKKIS